MVERVEEEYELADRIRVSSEWAKVTMVSRGISPARIEVLPQPLNLCRFHPRPKALLTSGPLNVCYVGVFNLGKGFLYLLRAVRSIGPGLAKLEMVGGTGNRSAKRLLANERKGLDLTTWAGDPLPAYHRADVFVLPSLHDGFGFVGAEAMACGLPVIVTHSCGVASWVRNNETGWTVNAGSADALANSLEDAMRRRADLVGMGQMAREDLEHLADSVSLTQLRSWVLGVG
jgi:glycosyltransferase involved in cell wall biosynthesis